MPVASMTIQASGPACFSSHSPSWAKPSGLLASLLRVRYLPLAWRVASSKVCLATSMPTTAIMLNCQSETMTGSSLHPVQPCCCEHMPWAGARHRADLADAGARGQNSLGRSLGALGWSRLALPAPDDQSGTIARQRAVVEIQGWSRRSLGHQ